MVVFSKNYTYIMYNLELKVEKDSLASQTFPAPIDIRVDGTISIGAGRVWLARLREGDIKATDIIALHDDAYEQKIFTRCKILFPDLLPRAIATDR